MAYPFVITSSYGPRNLGDGFHDGIDFATPRPTPLGATWDGEIEWQDQSAYGWVIWVIHEEGPAAMVAHCSRRVVPAGQQVKKGQLIAYSGGVPGERGAGNSTGAHVHYEVRPRGRRFASTNPDPHWIGGLWWPVTGEEEIVLSAREEFVLKKLVLALDERQKDAEGFVSDGIQSTQLLQGHLANHGSGGPHKHAVTGEAK